MKMPRLGTKTTGRVIPHRDETELADDNPLLSDPGAIVTKASFDIEHFASREVHSFEDKWSSPSHSREVGNLLSGYWMLRAEAYLNRRIFQLKRPL